MKSKIVELFAANTNDVDTNWSALIRQQSCAYLGRKCLKNRKSQPDIAIGTCTVRYGAGNREVIICPHRLLEKKKIFLDCIHLLTLHEPGNELHVVPEVTVPGGSIDYFLVSARDKKVMDFVGVELQTLDTTGTIWPERQRFLDAQGIPIDSADLGSVKPFGLNWKMTAKTTLVQLHHKVATLEGLGKHLVLVLQDCLLDYMQTEFSFSHVAQNARLGDSMHFHVYQLSQRDSTYSIQLSQRLSTDNEGIAKCLGLQMPARLELEKINQLLEKKLSSHTLLSIQ